MVIVTTTTRKDRTMKLFARIFAASLALIPHEQKVQWTDT